MANEPTITIDGIEYPLDRLSLEARKQLESLNLVDQKISENKQEIAIMQKTSIAYSRALV